MKSKQVRLKFNEERATIYDHTDAIMNQQRVFIIRINDSIHFRMFYGEILDFQQLAAAISDLLCRNGHLSFRLVSFERLFFFPWEQCGRSNAAKHNSFFSYWSQCFPRNNTIQTMQICMCTKFHWKLIQWNDCFVEVQINQIKGNVLVH